MSAHLQGHPQGFPPRPRRGHRRAGARLHHLARGALCRRDIEKLKSIVLEASPSRPFISIKPLSGDDHHLSPTARRWARASARAWRPSWRRGRARLGQGHRWIQADADAVELRRAVSRTPCPARRRWSEAEDAQFTDSSRSMAAYYMPMRLFGAGIRLVMIKATAMKWSVDPSKS